MSAPVQTLQTDFPLPRSLIGGTSSGDLLPGTAAADTFSAGAGNDTLEGGAGIDTAVFSGSLRDYQLGWDHGFLVVTDTNPADGNDGTDRLMQVERLQFADTGIALGVGGIFRVNSDPTRSGLGSGGSAFVATSEGGVFSAWIWDDEVFAQRFGSGGRPLGPEMVIAQNTSYLDQMGRKNIDATELADGRALLVWEQRDLSASNAYGIVGQWIAADGSASSAPFDLVPVAGGYRGLPQVVELGNGGIALSWLDAGGVELSVLDANGAIVVGSINVSATPPSFAADLTALTGGDLLVSWSGDPGDGQGTGVYWRLYAPDGTALTDEVLLQRNPGSQGLFGESCASALADGGFIVAWRSFASADPAAANVLYLQRYAADGVAAGDRFAVDVSTNLSIRSPEVIELAGGDLLVAWSGVVDGQACLFGQRIDRDGAAIGERFLIDTMRDVRNPVWSDPLADGSSVLQWIPDYSIRDQYAMHFDADGQVVLPRLQGSDAADHLDLRGAGGLQAIGGRGDDHYVLGGGEDLVTEYGGGGIDTIAADFAYTLGRAVENLTLTGTAHVAGTGNGLRNAISGNAGANLLRGLAGNDTLRGGGGDDTLAGGGDADRLQGGAGADTFRFGGPAVAVGAVDVVLDFTPGVDTVALDPHGFRGFTGSVVGDARLLAAPGVVAATTTAQRLLYDTDTGNLYYDRDGSGPGTSVWIAVFGEGMHPTLTAADFAIGG